MTTSYTWRQTAASSRQHWLYSGKKIRGMVYRLNDTAYSIYGEDYARNPFARTFLGVHPTLDEAKALLLTITASQAAENI